jgi:hypothetical protein
MQPVHFVLLSCSLRTEPIHEIFGSRWRWILRFWYFWTWHRVVLCIGANVSEESATSLFITEDLDSSSSVTLVHIYQPTYMVIPEDRYIQSHSKLLSGFPFIGHGNLYNNVESLCTCGVFVTRSISVRPIWLRNETINEPTLRISSRNSRSSWKIRWFAIRIVRVNWSDSLRMLLTELHYS